MWTISCWWKVEKVIILEPKKGRIFINRTASLKFMSSPLLTSSYFCTRYSSTVAVQATLKITISSSFYVSGAFAILCYHQINSTYPPSMLCLFIFQNWKSLKQLRMKEELSLHNHKRKYFTTLQANAENAILWKKTLWQISKRSVFAACMFSEHIYRWKNWVKLYVHTQFSITFCITVPYHFLVGLLGTLVVQKWLPFSGWRNTLFFCNACVFIVPSFHSRLWLSSASSVFL